MPTYFNDICYVAQQAGADLLAALGLTNIPVANIRQGITNLPAADPQVVVYCLKMVASANNNYEGLWAGKLHFEVHSLRDGDGPGGNAPVRPEDHHARAGEVFSILMGANTASDLSFSGEFTCQEAVPSEQGWFIHKERNAWVSYIIFDLDGCAGRFIDIT